MFEAGQLTADRTPLAVRQADGNAPKRDRRQLLTKIDGRLPLGKRIKRLVSLFEAAFPAEALVRSEERRVGKECW